MESTSIYRRELKLPAIAFSDPDTGRRLFHEALDAGYCEGYFSLAEQFQSQSHYAFW
jgi:hypothetical protein